MKNATFASGRFILAVAFSLGLSAWAGSTQADVIATGNTTPTPTSTGSSNNLYIGYTSNGSMQINGNGALHSVNSNNGYVGYNPSVTGTVTVDGAGSAWTNSGNLHVGEKGIATLTISNGGQASNIYAYIGNFNDSAGTVTVTGSNSTWTNSQDLLVGNGGTGTLTISNGGKVSNIYAYIGKNSSNDTVTVTGSNSMWTNSRDLLVGYSGTGTLTISNGGKVTDSRATIGEQYGGGTGTVTVKDTGSKWTSSSNLIVGSDGIGTLNIEGGTVTTGSDLKIAANSGSSGTVNLSGGTLDLQGHNATFGSGTAAFNFTGGTLQGVGSFLSDLNQNGGTLNIGKPSNAAGDKMAVSKSYTLAQAGTLNIKFDKTANTADQLNVTGNVTLNKNATINLTQKDSAKLTNGYVIGGSGNYVISSSAGTLTDNGAVITYNGIQSPFLSFLGSVNANKYMITVSRKSYAAVAANNGFTSDQKAVARSLDQLVGSSNPANTTMLNDINSLSVSQYQTALKTLSPERIGTMVHVTTTNAIQFNNSVFTLLGQIHSGTAQMASLNDPGSQVADASNGSAADASAMHHANEKYHGLNVFFHPFGAFGSRDTQADRTGYDFNDEGLIGGVETRLNDHWIGGVSLGYTHSQVDFNNNGGNIRGNNICGGLFAGGSWDPWYVNTSASGSYQWNDSKRNLTSPFTSTSNGSYTLWTASVAAEGGVHLHVKVKDTPLTVTPFAGLYYTYIYQNGFTESNSALPAAALVMDSSDTSALRSNLGARVSFDTTIAGHTVTPSLSAAWVQDYLNKTNLSGHFVNSSSNFTVQSGLGSQAGAAVSLAVDTKLESNMNLNVRYDGEYAAHSNSNIFSANLTIRF